MDDPLLESIEIADIKSLNNIKRREDALSYYSESASEYCKTTGENYPLKFKKI